MKKITIVSILTAVLLSTFAPISFALHDWYEGYQLEPYWARSKSPLVVQFDDRQILDLEKNILVARGEAAIFSFGLRNKGVIEDKAIESSKRALIEAARGLRVDSERRVSDLIKVGPALGKEIEKYVRSNYNTMHFRIFTMRGTLRVTSSVKYDGPNGLLSIIYPYLATNEAANTDENPDESAESASPTPESGIKGDYTGLIIDARKLKLIPAIYPKIVNSSGEAIFKGGKVEYSGSLDAAYKDPKVGKNPLVVKAAGSRKNCEPIVSVEDGEKIIAEDRAGVVIVI